MSIVLTGSVTLSLSLSPASGTPTTASFNAVLTFVYTGTPTPTGTITLTIDGVGGGSIAVALSGSNQQSIGVGLNNPAFVGNHTVTAHYSGDSNWSPANSAQATFTVTGIDPPMGSQALARPQYVAAASSGTLTRTQIENGEMMAQVYLVSGMAILASGSGRYDSNTVATLTGTVAGAAVRETLTVSVDDSGGISSLTGFDNTAQWDAPPLLTISRWDGSGSSANYLGS